MGSDQGQHIGFRGNMRDQDRKTGGNICKTDKFPERMRFICDLTGNFKSVEYRRFLQHMQGILSIGKAVEQKTINDVGSVASLGHCTEIDEPPGCCADLLLNGSRDAGGFFCVRLNMAVIAEQLQIADWFRHQPYIAVAETGIPGFIDAGQDRRKIRTAGVNSHNKILSEIN